MRSRILAVFGVRFQGEIDDSRPEGQRVVSSAIKFLAMIAVSPRNGVRLKGTEINSRILLIYPQGVECACFVE